MALLADQGLELRERKEATGEGSLVTSGHLWPSLAPTCSVTPLGSSVKVLCVLVELPRKLEPTFIIDL